MKQQLFIAILALLLLPVLSGCGKPSEPTAEPQARDFTFAVLADKTGGARPGVFEKALQQVVTRQPNLVLSVGDLIQGYTDNEAELNRQWDELDTVLATLTMPFYYVPGNHDMTNAQMARMWQQRYGKPNKAFVYENVLFLCLNTQQPDGADVNAGQVEFVRKALAENTNVRWTFLFFHHPWWSYPNDEWRTIEGLLARRPHTVFAGHYHKYLKKKRNGGDYHILATTGGVSDLRGPAYGEFDHFVWVEMKGDRPEISNILLDGTVLGDSVRTPETAALIDSVAQGQSVRPQAFLAEKPQSSDIKSSIIVQNPADVPMTFAGEFEDPPNLDLQPARFEETITPGGQKNVAVHLRGGAEYDIAEEPALRLNWRVRWPLNERTGGEYEYDQPLEATGTRSIEIDTTYRCPAIAQAPKIDGALDEWETLPIRCARPAQFLFTKSSWSGPKDSSFRFAAGHDSEFIYFAIAVTDDRLVTHPGYGPNLQDGIELYLDARPRPKISADILDGQPADNTKLPFLLLQISPTATGPATLAAVGDHPENINAACVTTAQGYTAEIAVPTAYLRAKQGEDWKTFRLNIAVSDFDGNQGDGANAAQIWWRPDWRRGKDYPEAGYFEKE